MFNAEDAGFPPKTNPLRGDETVAELRARLDGLGPDADAAPILSRVEQFVRLYLAAPEEVYLPLAILFVATHVADLFYSFPYVGVTSPTKGCGKSRVLELAHLLCVRPQSITAASVAAAFRMLGNCPTLLWDECESFRNKHRSECTDQIIQILNVGYKKGATVPRADGPNHTVVPYPVYGPKMFTAIRDLPATLADRSIRVHLQKRPKSKKLKRWKEKRVAEEAAPIQQAIADWARVNRERVILADDNMDDLEFLEDREDEIWSPLFVVCGLIAPERMKELQNCARALTKKKATNSVEDELALKLLADIRELRPEVVKFGERDAREKLLTSSAFLVAKLTAIEESPWHDPKRPLNENRLARMLRPFEVEHRLVRVGTKAGLSRYFWEELEAVFSAYLPCSDSQPSTPSTNRADIGDFADFEPST
jgi:hypothetical protein